MSDSQDNKSVFFRVEQCRYGGFVLKDDGGDNLQAFRTLKEVIEHLDIAMRDCFDEGHHDRRMAKRFAPPAAPGMHLPDPADAFYEDTAPPARRGVWGTLKAVAGGKS